MNLLGFTLSFRQIMSTLEKCIIIKEFDVDVFFIIMLVPTFQQTNCVL